ncbi:6-carboxytetrahydropterin synthase QueD [Veillonella montpellierensis]|uniref:6-carboxytetrahydropterin synthase QueD n=1 Tax=Veillonella montpellierensis TaxID=187328 RepID=UPI0023F9802A|nr:6-carboxytetrahydropterin synthase QueD [Veillonella montpellierensis]
MYFISKRMEISAAHQLHLSYQSKCENLHGHNWIITVYCYAEELNKDGMVIDFTHIKKEVHDVFDHHIINDIVPFKDELNPTAENIAKWIVDTIPSCYKAVVQETEGNEACYVQPGLPIEVYMGQL